MWFPCRVPLHLVLVSSCILLPTIFGSSRYVKTEANGYDTESELVDLLLELRENLHSKKVLLRIF